MEEKSVTLLDMFKYQDSPVRHVIDENNDPWWVAVDVCKVLELDNVARAVSRLDGDEVTQSKVIDSLGRLQTTTLVNEPGLYSLILRSEKPEAKAFKRWVTHELLPAIRKTGSYSLPGAPNLDAISQRVGEALEKIKEGKLEIAEAKLEVKEYADELKRIRHTAILEDSRFRKGVAAPQPKMKPLPTDKEKILQVINSKFRRRWGNSYIITQAGSTQLRKVGSIAVRKILDELVIEGKVEKEGYGKRALYRKASL
jgi:prophage antirepressor-like protein